MFVTISVIAALSFMSDHPFDQGSRESVLNSEFLSWQGMLQDSWQLLAALFLRTKKSANSGFCPTRVSCCDRKKANDTWSWIFFCFPVSFPLTWVGGGLQLRERL